MNNGTVTGSTYGQLVPMPNGDSFYFVNTMTLGESLIVATVCLLLAFLVVKWLLDSAWGRRT